MTYENGKEFLMDYSDLNYLQECKRNFIFKDEQSIYPSYLLNYSRVNLLEYIYNIREITFLCEFVNGNPSDLRRDNVQIYHKKHAWILLNYADVKYYAGHYKSTGPDAYIMKNPLWNVKDKTTGLEHLLMFCEPDNFVSLCSESYHNIRSFEEEHGKTLVFHVNANGYVVSNFRNLFMQDIIYNGIKQIGFVTHNDKNPLNNVLSNLVLCPPIEKTKLAILKIRTIEEKNDCKVRTTVMEPVPNIESRINYNRAKYEALLSDYKILEYFPGHWINKGADANSMKNPRWNIQTANGVIKMVMYCEVDTFVEICAASYQKIKDYEMRENNGKPITFYKLSNGYIKSSSCLYMHQIIMDCYGNGKGTMNISVDHIDQNPLNNSLANLRIATRAEQEQNSTGIKDGTKRKRQCIARDLPEGLTQNMMRKFVVYYKECYNKEQELYREFFKVEGHPKLDGKIWISSKSNKVTWAEKLTEANKVVDDLLLNILPVVTEKQVPKYYRIEEKAGKTHLLYERRSEEGNRYNLSMIMPPAYTLEKELEKICLKLREKYPNNKDLFSYIPADLTRAIP